MNRGFSLVELSIVLVILGLLTGGILAGQSLIRAAELRSVGTDIDRFIGATYAFRDKYHNLPGDMTNATAFWGEAHATPATCRTTIGTGTQTCNGDGNGTLMFNAPASNERFRYWQHLANATLIEGTYSGVQGSGGAYDSIIGENVPRGRIQNLGYYVDWLGVITVAHTSMFPGFYGNELRMGAKRTNDAPDDSIFRPEEAWNIDAKLDDGKPGTGRVRSRKNGSTVTPNCATTADAASAEYSLGMNSVECSLFVITGF